ncbi:hypothetical protein M438DRAFT_197975 [Aureobasidium pullulans EXF-150]|uniref:Uncharacterized protein n=1 Tax=Aureobasidium pullulans EXF-150 TaxID=1043002 RepID=A0A074XJ78_AURPU|nr:uncharacterized protein M438DRAFT_197975 [Aureobasidium pullulans EXF-150]KEQ85568.1 hypothetical protein M438DRAFT_197975 [Aureobasidium pullulans EXF-150]
MFSQPTDVYWQDKETLSSFPWDRLVPILHYYIRAVLISGMLTCRLLVLESSLPTSMISLQHKRRHISRSIVVILGRQCRVNGSLFDCIEKEYEK